MTNPANRPGRLGVGVVGAGRVGAVLACALRSVGHAVVGASGSSPETQDRVETLLPGVPLLGIEDVVERAEVVLLTVPDDVLPELVAGLARLDRWQTGQIVVHTSGRYGTDVLAPAARAGAIPLAIHPAMTFTGTSLDLSRLTGCPFAVTAAPAVLPIAQALVVEIGGEPVVLEEGQRAAYHAALAHGANHLVTLVTQAERALESCGIDEPGRLLTPLLTAALDGALRSGESELTGPVVRGDAGTVADHLAALAGTGQGDVVATYRHLARVTTQRALAARRITAPTAERLLAILDAAADAAPAAGPAAPSGPAQAAEPVTDAGGATLARTRAELGATLEQRTGRRGLVMTMGALHAGHLSLVREARRRADHVVVSIFVNPLQFGPGEDLAAYPRDLAADLALLRGEGVDVVFAPAEEEMYPAHPLVRLDPGPAGTVLEGRARPTHFAGVLQVVNKVFNLVRPDLAVFGQKDAQQLALVRTMVRDLDMGVEIVAVPVQRDDDGLALSSRNAYLSADERRRALSLVRGLRAGREAAATGAGPAQIEAAARRTIEETHGVRVDYVALVDPDTFLPVEGSGPALLAVAAWVGAARLIDNMTVELRGQG